MTRILLLFSRALRLRCPNCGGGQIFDSWFRLKPVCPTCNLRFDRGEQGYEVGSYWFNITAAELILLAVIGVIVLRTWPTPPWAILQYVAPALMVLLPLGFFPFSKTLFVAFDLVFRPDRPGENP